MAEVLGLILPLFGLIFLGAVTARITKQPVEALGWMNTFIVYVALPALFFNLLSKTPVEKLASWGFIFTSVGTTFAIFWGIILIGWLARRGNLGERAVQGLAGAYGNIGYMGPAIAILALGENAAIPVALIFCFENIMHFTQMPALMAISGGRKTSLPSLILEIARRIAFHPFIIATAIGVLAAYFHFSAPGPVEKLLSYLSSAAAPCALFALGVTLALRPLKRVPVELSYIVPIKLIVHPALTYVLLSLVGDFDPIWVATATLLASLPTATNVFVIAQQYSSWVERASAVILVTTILSVATVSVLIYMVTTGILPGDLFPG
jgi:malonate transporter